MVGLGWCPTGRGDGSHACGLRREGGEGDECDSQTPGTAVQSRGISTASYNEESDELARWMPPPDTPAEKLIPVDYLWPLNYVHSDWVDAMTLKYRFASEAQLLRHLIFIANEEPPSNKRLIFKVVRCLHCSQSVRAGHIPKRERTLAVYPFQLEWLTVIFKKCSHKSVEKTLRIIVDFYWYYCGSGTTTPDEVKERDLFLRNRSKPSLPQEGS
ncbi:hypothetical protein CYMTET_38524 [Cymbomonas tetramitiformis]|uniref:Uncharacterized protein n=1 Tax=Cymbomonas tetramitiformis TaxID=36881 RepID=A0AAE0CBT8_9CHLO|nr:hypothetical protein CYMTET_38524 [Cymbomonas tetramitiformis]